MILGFLFVRPIPPPHLDPTARLEHADGDTSSDYGVGEGFGGGTPTTYSANNTSHTHLLSQEEDEDEMARDPEFELDEEAPLVSPSHVQPTSDYVAPAAADSVMLSPPHTGIARHRSLNSRSLSRNSTRSHLNKSFEGTVNIHGKRLFTTIDFWLLFTISSLCKCSYGLIDSLLTCMK